MARWEETYDAQVDLVTGLTSGFTRRQVMGFMKSVNRTSGVWGEDANMATRLAAMVFNADPIYVEPEMQQVWLAAAEGWKMEPLLPEDLITKTGFVYLPRAVRMTDLRDKEISYRAIMWHPQRFSLQERKKEDADDGALLVRDVETYDAGTAAPVDFDEPIRPRRITPTGSEETIVAPYDRLRVQKVGDGEYAADGVLVSLWHHTRDFDEVAPGMDRQLPPMLILSHVMPWTYQAEWSVSEDPRSIVRPTQALWRLLTQTITQVSREQPTGQVRKRWRRAGMPEKKVTIVRLRRPRHDRQDDAEPRTVDWSHRWLVGGHWRNQWYPSLGLHRQIFISPYVKGPDDKPLDPVKLRVFELVR